MYVIDKRYERQEAFKKHVLGYDERVYIVLAKRVRDEDGSFPRGSLVRVKVDYKARKVLLNDVMSDCCVIVSVNSFQKLLGNLNISEKGVLPKEEIKSTIGSILFDLAFYTFAWLFVIVGLGSIFFGARLSINLIVVALLPVVMIVLIYVVGFYLRYRQFKNV